MSTHIQSVSHRSCSYFIIEVSLCLFYPSIIRIRACFEISLIKNNTAENILVCVCIHTQTHNFWFISQKSNPRSGCVRSKDRYIKKMYIFNQIALQEYFFNLYKQPQINFIFLRERNSFTDKLYSDKIILNKCLPCATAVSKTGVQLLLLQD